MCSGVFRLDFKGPISQNQGELGRVRMPGPRSGAMSRSCGQMSIDRAEQLKEKLTDKYVVVDSSIPELRRFANWTGKVKTVNMSCRALVEFDGPVDIGWYDINPDFLVVVDGPRPKAAPAAKAPAAAKPAASAAVAPKPAAAPGKSPLDAIRAQQAAKSGAAAPTPAAGAKPSPLDMIRKQQAAKKAEEAAPAAAVAETPAPVAESVAEPAPPAAPAAKTPLPTTGPDGKPLSKLDMIRMQGAKKS